MTLDINQFSQMIPSNPNPQAWFTPAVDMFSKYNITTLNRVAGFMAQCGWESNDFNSILENMNYSWQRLRQVFPNRFPTDAAAQQVDHQPEAIANIVYSNMLGNGDPASGDGWRFRGHGLIQLTGRYNFTQFGNTIGMTAEQAVEYAATPQGALESACWYWNSRNVSQYCDADDINGMTYAVNGGYNGLAQRSQRYTTNKAILGSQQ